MSKYNKYYLYDLILGNDYLTSLPIDDFTPPGWPKLNDFELYEGRVSAIIKYIDAHIAQLDVLTGADAINIINQRDDIKKWLDPETNEDLIKSYYEFIHDDNSPEHTFKALLEHLLNVSHERIQEFIKATKQLRGERIVNVLLDGNRTRLIVDGEEKRFGVKIYDNNVTLEDCHKAMERLAEFDCYPETLTFMLSVYADAGNNDYGERVINKEAVYDAVTDKLEIYVNGELIQ